MRGTHGNSEAGIQFIYLSGGGKDLLADLVAELARLQALINQLKAARRDAESESFRKQLESGKLLAAMWRERFVLWRDLRPRRVRKRIESLPLAGNQAREGSRL